MCHAHKHCELKALAARINSGNGGLKVILLIFKHVIHMQKLGAVAISRAIMMNQWAQDLIPSICVFWSMAASVEMRLKET